MPNDSASGGFLTAENAGPPEDAAFDAILQSLVVGITGLGLAYVRPRWTAPTVSPAPTDPMTNWCAIGVVDDAPASNYFERHDGSADGGTGSSTTQIQSVVTIMASFYGGSARSTAKLFRDGLMVPQNREMLFPYGIVLPDMPDTARFVPEIINLQTRPRVDVTFRLRVPSVRVWPIRNIITVQGTILADDGENVPFTAQD